MIWSLLPSPISSYTSLLYLQSSPLKVSYFLIYKYALSLSLSGICISTLFDDYDGMREGMSVLTIIFLSPKTRLGTKLARGIRLDRNIQIYQLHCSRYLLTLEVFLVGGVTVIYLLVCFKAVWWIFKCRSVWERTGTQLITMMFWRLCLNEKLQSYFSESQSADQVSLLYMSHFPNESNGQDLSCNLGPYCQLFFQI